MSVMGARGVDSLDHDNHSEDTRPGDGQGDRGA